MKRFVDGKITITPSAVNEVGEAHTFTVDVEQDDGLVANAPGGDAVTGFGPVTVGNADVTLTDANGAAATLNAAASTCDDAQPAGDNLDANGQCTVVFTSATAGTVTGHASATFTVGGEVLTRQTNGTGQQRLRRREAVRGRQDHHHALGRERGGRGPHVHRGRGAGRRPGRRAPGGDAVTGFGPVTVGNADVTLTDANGAAATLNAAASTCDDAQPAGDNLDANGQCTVVFTSATAGTVTGHARRPSRSAARSSPARPTAQGSNRPDAVKRFVDGKITITPSAVNEVGEAHTFTVDVEQDDGLAANAPGGDAVTGFGPVTVGNADVTLTDANGAAATLNAAASTCDNNQPSGDNLNANGRCTVVFTSNTAGTVTGHATATFTVGGEVLTRQTNGQGSNGSDAVKRFVDGKITITPSAVNEVGEAHTFTVDVEKDDGLPAGRDRR